MDPDHAHRLEHLLICHHLLVNTSQSRDLSFRGLERGITLAGLPSANHIEGPQSTPCHTTFVRSFFISASQQSWHDAAGFSFHLHVWPAYVLHSDSYRSTLVGDRLARWVGLFHCRNSGRNTAYLWLRHFSLVGPQACILAVPFRAS